ncbi:MAG TPA: hypothetical protein VFZ69_04240 [Longimicrobiales bacterium]
MRRRTAALGMLLLLSGACREADGPADPGTPDALIFLSSDPGGARIGIDNRNTGLVTPDTIGLRRGERLIELVLDSAGFTYDYAVLIGVVPSDSVGTLTLPLGLQCFQLTGACMTAARRQYETAGMRIGTNGLGSLFYAQGSGQGIVWPVTGTDGYASSGMPLIAGLANDREVALGLYDHNMLVGRPAPRVTRAGGTFRLERVSWVLPPNDLALNPGTVRGIQVEEELLAADGIDGVLIVRLRFRNRSDDALVHAFAPHIARSTVTYTNTWVGFAIDPDIGSAADDWVSYDIERNMVFAYDADFAETQFGGGAATAPGLIGLRVLEAPPGTNVLLNAWPPAGDWWAGTQSEITGYGLLTGTSIYSPDHPHGQVGHVPPSSADMRIAVTAGPLTLIPGGEAEIVIAIAVAPPTPGTFTSGTTMAPGDPLDTSRPLFAVAADLRARMAAAETLWQP